MLLFRTSIDHKSANRIKLSQLVLELFHLTDLNPKVLEWVDGCMDVCGWLSHACMHTHMLNMPI